MARSSLHGLSGTAVVLLILLAPLLVVAQFGHFFENMFSGGSGGGGGQRGRGGNVASDSEWYRRTYDGATCDKYLCPGTLACVDKPTHCPCAWPDFEEKFELDKDGLALCLSKSPVKVGSGKGVEKVGRKVELARKGLL